MGKTEFGASIWIFETRSIFATAWMLLRLMVRDTRPAWLVNSRSVRNAVKLLRNHRASRRPSGIAICRAPGAKKREKRNRGGGFTLICPLPDPSSAPASLVSNRPSPQCDGTRAASVRSPNSGIKRLETRIDGRRNALERIPSRPFSEYNSGSSPARFRQLPSARESASELRTLLRLREFDPHGRILPDRFAI